MGFLRISTALFAIVTGSLASDCFLQYSASIAVSSSCGRSVIIDGCLSQLQDFNERDVRNCYIVAGCSFDEAEDEAGLAIQHCRELLVINDLKRRDTASVNTDLQIATADEDSSAGASSAEVSNEENSSVGASSAEASSAKDSSAQASTTKASSEEVPSTSVLSTIASSTFPSSTIVSSTKVSSTSISTSTNSMSGTACFITSTKDIEICDLHTTGGRTETGTCTEGKSVSSTCAANRICTTDANGGDICMEKQGIKTAGVVISIVFGVVAVVNFGALFFMCFRGSKKQKAVTLKAQVAETSRTPLITKDTVL
ncbi:hypothetical protein AK830_g1252 [Neonectria ditissima]|uniref:Extracellular membrane protein CFEM domain-containing protein n=1 Tax=Neonectria ditissima TaxID=78410 RepID=A0A0P7BV55_9HYPO|nr:hypothetical protein AK830_g1252 [Neonectria ditissima]